MDRCKRVSNISSNRLSSKNIIKSSQKAVVNELARRVRAVTSVSDSMHVLRTSSLKGATFGGRLKVFFCLFVNIYQLR